MRILARWALVIVCFALALSAGARAHAQSNCQLPYLLQNNTFADADQVMANFNTLTACLGGGLTTVTSNVNLIAATTSTQGAVYRSGFRAPGDGGGAYYTWSGSPCTMNSGAGDNGSQVAPTTGGCWNIIWEPNESPRIWGCAGDGVTLDTACLQSAASALQGTGRALALGPSMYAVGDNTITITAPIKIIGGGSACRYAPPACGTAPAARSGFYSTAPNQTLFFFSGVGASNSELSDFTIRMDGKAGSFVNTSGAAIKISSGTPNVTLTDMYIHDLLIWSPCFGIDDQGSNESYYHHNQIYAVYGPSCAGVRLGLNTTGGATVGPRLDQNSITCNPNNSPSSTGRAGVLVLDAGGAYFTANDILYCVSGTEINPGASQSVFWATFTGTVAGDTSHGNDIYVNTSSSTATILGLQFTGSWGSNAGAQGLYGGDGASFLIRNDGAGLVRGIQISGQRDLSFGAGNALEIDAGDDITVIGSTLCPASLGTVAAAVAVGGAATNVKFLNNRIGYCYQAPTSTILTGINIAAGAGVTQIIGNDFTGVSGNLIFWQGLPAPSQHLIIKDNLGLDDNVSGPITPTSSITLPFYDHIFLASGATPIQTMLNSWNERQVFIEPNGVANFTTGGNICNAMSTNLMVIATWSPDAVCWLLK